MGRIVGMAGGDLCVVVSAMGKMTNALERVLAGEPTADVRRYHTAICMELFGHVPLRVAEFLDELDAAPTGTSDADYDRVVSYGELISTAIVAEFLGAKWVDARRCFVTDSVHKAASVDMTETAKRLRAEAMPLFVTQGFIGASKEGATTTLGREGSDYSAAVAAAVLDAESLTIWKDVPGVMSADPHVDPTAVLLPELTYKKAFEMASAGAKVIHPKTMAPLEARGIPLYVRPFGAPSEKGTVIR